MQNVFESVFLKKFNNYIFRKCSIMSQSVMLMMMRDCLANDVARWTTHQSKDIASIAAHVSEFSTNIESLKSELSAERKKNKDASSRIASTKKEAAVERETSASMRRQYESKLKVYSYLHDMMYAAANQLQLASYLINLRALRAHP